jgi:DeoR family fructose operon transcriptional repressor
MAGMKVDRLTAIRQHLYLHGPSTIQDLADATGASLATLRRDLITLEEEGAIDRVHGGARLAEGSNVEVAFEQRQKQHLEAKRAIAEAAYELLVPHATVFLDAGTTVLQLARRIRIAPLPLTVFTNGLLVAQEFLNVPKLRVTLLGGQLRSENASIVGPQAEWMLERLWFDQLFLGAGAVSTDESIYSVDISEAALNGRMLARSARRLLLADGSKFGTTATYAVAPVASVNQVITDPSLPADWRQRFARLNVQVITAGARAVAGAA